MIVLRYLLRILDAVSMPRAALALLRAWMRLAPRDANAALELMSRAFAAGKLPIARSACLAVLAVRSTHAPTLKRLASCCMSQGDHDMAVDPYRRIDAMQPGNRQGILKQR